MSMSAKELFGPGNKKPFGQRIILKHAVSKEEPLMYSQFCYYIQQDEQKRRATMHINRKPAEQVEVDWAGDPAHITDPDTGRILDAQIFVGCYDPQSVSIRRSLIDQKQAIMDCSTRPHVRVLWRCCKDSCAGQLSHCCGS